MSLSPQPPKRRDQIRKFFGRSTSLLPIHPTAAPVRNLSTNPANTSLGSGILADALEALEPNDRKTVRTLLLPTNAISIDTAFDEVHNCTRQLQQRCVDKRWSWNYEGREVYLFDQVGKVVQLLDRFKAVGDIVANVDPIHIGLPWAGIRAILEVALADSHQRDVLVTGIKLALYMGNRLKAYLDIFARLSSSLTTANFRKAIVNLYAHILGFFAQAIRVQQKRSIARVSQALWNSSSLMQFEQRCDILCVRASEEARICGSRGSLDAQLRSLDEIHNVRIGVEKLQERVDLGKLETAKGATYNSLTEGELSRCLPDTRTDLLQQIAGWITDQAGKRIFWLCGKAGTGKSTISRTVAQKLDDDGLLGASFFFKRGRAGRSHAGLMFPTIARQLADLFPAIARAIAASLDQDSLLCDRYLSTQFYRLLVEPLRKVDQISLPSAGVVLVIDALDECDNSESIRTTLLLLSKVEEITSIRLRIFVTSRPELPVELGFKNMSGDLHHDVRLEVAQEISIEHDIRVFYEHQFAEIRKSSLLQDDELPAEWPGEQSTRALVVQAMPLFIFAFTVSRYISANPRRNLATMLLQSRDKSPTGLKGTYLPILDQVVASEGDGEQKDRILDFKAVVGSIVLLYDPLSASALARLLKVEAGDIGRVLRPLHSVLNIPRASDGKIDRMTPITLFHLSFRDFLLDPKLKSQNAFWVQADETHRTLGMRCIHLLELGGLKEDICGVLRPGIRRADVAKSLVHTSLPEDVAYACCYWVQHILMSNSLLDDDGVAHQFLQKHLLHWMEALSWLGKASDVIHSLETLKSIVAVDQGKRMAALLDDASRFALRNRYIIDEAPLQTYMSALLFAPSLSEVRQIFGSGLQTHFESLPQVPQHWGAERQKLEGHDDVVSAVAFSPDGKTVASGSWDKTVRLWDAATGEERQKLEGHDSGVNAVAFSPDGKTVASGSWDKTVRLWSMTGKQTQHFQTREVPRRVHFTNDGSALDTDVGTFDLSTPSDHLQTSPSPPAVPVVLDSPWVQRNGLDLLWLPQEYRGTHLATHGAFLVIGQASGAMSFILFKL